MNGGLFSGNLLPVLAQYDRYPLLCNDPQFSLHLLRLMNQAEILLWSPVEQADLCRIQLRAETEIQQQELSAFAMKNEQVLQEKLRFPVLFRDALAMDNGQSLDEKMQLSAERRVNEWRDTGKSSRI